MGSSAGVAIPRCARRSKQLIGCGSAATNQLSSFLQASIGEFSP